jgi:hypothetical protein
MERFKPDFWRTFLPGFSTVPLANKVGANKVGVLLFFSFVFVNRNDGFLVMAA